MKSLSSINAPALAGVVREETAIKAIAEIKNCLYGGADRYTESSTMEQLDLRTSRTIVDAMKKIY